MRLFVTFWVFALLAIGGFALVDEARLETTVPVANKDDEDSASAGFRLVVRAGDTGEELRDVEVRQTIDSGGISISGGTREEMREQIRELGSQSEGEGPYAAVTLVEAAASPVSLKPTDRLAELFVRSPGYAWATFETRLVNGGGASIVLWPAARLEVEFDGEVPEGVVAHLRFYEMGAIAKMFDAMKDQPGGPEAIRMQATRLGFHDPDDEKSVAVMNAMLKAPLAQPELGSFRGAMRVSSSEPLVFESLATSPYVVQLELGPWYDEPTVLASATVDLQKETKQQIRLSFHVEAVPEPIDVSGTLVLPAAWRASPADRSIPVETKIELRLLDPPLLDRKEWMTVARCMEALPTEGDVTYGVAFFSLQPGRYEARVSDPAVNWKLTIEEPGDVELRIPAPSEVVLRVVDPETKQPASGASVVWYPEGNLSNLRSEMVGVAADPETRAIRFWTAPGRVTLNGDADGLRLVRKTIEVKPGRNEIDVVGTPEYAFTVRRIGDDGLVRIGSREEPLSDLLELANRMNVRGVGLGSAVLWSNERDEGSYIVVSAPGTYRFDVPAVEGYRPVPTQEVVIEDNRPVVHEIRLERIESPERPPEKSR